MTVMDAPGKVAMIREVAAAHPDHRAFVETGTAVGELPFGVRDIFDRIVTVEMDPGNYRGAAHRLLPYPHIRVMHGDAGDYIGPILDALDEPCILWLDAHEIADDGHSSMVAEFKALAHGSARHVILVDDARLCSGRKGWMTLDQISAWAEAHGYTDLGVTDDVVQLVP